MKHKEDEEVGETHEEEERKEGVMLEKKEEQKTEERERSDVGRRGAHGR